MSKNTKIIAIVGGILIIAAAIYGGKTILTVYTGGKKGAPRVKYSKQDILLHECDANGHACQHDAKGNPVHKKGAKTCTPAKDGKKICVQLYVKKCGNAEFAKANPTACMRAKKAAAALKKDDGDDDDDGE